MKVSVFVSASYEDQKAIVGPWPARASKYDEAAGTRSIQAGLRMAELADDMGYDWISCSEHHYTTAFLTPAPMIFASAISQRVKRARIAVLGPTMPLNNPVRVAEEIALLDQITDGRLVVALLRGTAGEMLTYGANPAESRAVYQEAIEIIQKALSEPEPFGWEGRHFKYRTISVWPRPIQKPVPLVGSGSRDSLGFAAAHHLKSGISFTNLAGVTEQVKLYFEAAREAGWEATPDDIVYRGWIHVAETDDQAREEVEEYFGHGGNSLPTTITGSILSGRAVGGTNPKQAPPSAPAGRQAGAAFGVFSPQFVGSPDTVYEQIREFHEAGVGVLDVGFQWRGAPHDKAYHAVELFGKEVLPRVHELGIPVGVR